jgi:hypothetical protein
VLADTAAAANAYVKVKPGLSSPNAAPTAATALLTMPFTIDSAGTYNLRARLNVPIGEDYGYWLKIDGGAYRLVGSQLATNPGFENGLTGWTTVNSGGATVSANSVAADAHSGTGSMKVVNPTDQRGLPNDHRQAIHDFLLGAGRGGWGLYPALDRAFEPPVPGRPGDWNGVAAGYLDHYRRRRFDHLFV